MKIYSEPVDCWDLFQLRSMETLENSGAFV